MNLLTFRSVGLPTCLPQNISLLAKGEAPLLCAQLSMKRPTSVAANVPVARTWKKWQSRVLCVNAATKKYINKLVTCLAEVLLLSTVRIWDRNMFTCNICTPWWTNSMNLVALGWVRSNSTYLFCGNTFCGFHYWPWSAFGHLFESKFNLLC